MSESLRDKKIRVLTAAKKAVDELIKVLEDTIIGNSDEGDISADKMKNAAMAKRLAFEDALTMLDRIRTEEESLNQSDEISEAARSTRGFAERNTDKKK
jgi:hypothetical protein